VTSCKRDGIDPFACLRDPFTRLSEPAAPADIPELTPAALALSQSSPLQAAA